MGSFPQQNSTSLLAVGVGRVGAAVGVVVANSFSVPFALGPPMLASKAIGRTRAHRGGAGEENTTDELANIPPLLVTRESLGEDVRRHLFESH